MAEPRLLLDNDALLKAAHWNLLDAIPLLVGGTWADTACLPQFPQRVRRAEPKLFADAAVANALDACLRSCGALPAPDLQILSALQAVPNIDAGELLLVAALATTPQALLLTGDKRALAALASTGAIAVCQHRFICIEQLLWHGLDQLGANELVKRVRLWPPRDGAARAIVGSTGDKTESDLREGLQSYLRWLDSEAPGLLMRGWGL